VSGQGGGLATRGERTLLLISTLFLLLGAAPAAHATITYRVSLARPEQHIFHVTMVVPKVSGDLTLQMPAWNALYQIRDFSHHVQQVEAFAEGSGGLAENTKLLRAEKIDKQTWRIAGEDSRIRDITIRYAAYWDDPGPFGTQLNASHAFINPAMILMYVPNRRGEEAMVTFGGVPDGWRWITSAPVVLQPAGPAETPGTLVSSYDQLTDSPVEIGKFDEFALPGFPNIRVVVHGDNWDRARMQDELTRICKYELTLMGGAPFKNYTFLYHIGKAAAGSGGGMEHADSTAISIPSDQFLASVSAHEFFHLWNVKRIRPASLDPVDYTKEQYTRALWFAEGVTSTYASYTLERTGIWKKQQFYDDLAGQISELERRPANRWQSAEQSSLDAWLEKYPLYNQPDFSVSYYTKGQILGVLLDLLIRDRTDGAKSLDDVMRAMNTDFAGRNRPYRDSLDIRLTAERVAGGSFEDFFAKYVAAAEPLPCEQELALAGLELRRMERKRPVLGFYYERDAAGNYFVRDVEPGSGAAEAGLQPNDSILAWDGAEPPRRAERWLRERQPGETLRLKVRRSGNELELQIRLGEAGELYFEIAESARATAKARRIREGWLRGSLAAGAAAAAGAQ
jgi:predicted metalloprotease with PDZ domain